MPQLQTAKRPHSFSLTASAFLAARNSLPIEIAVSRKPIGERCLDDFLLCGRAPAAELLFEIGPFERIGRFGLNSSRQGRKQVAYEAIRFFLFHGPASPRRSNLPPSLFSRG